MKTVASCADCHYPIGISSPGEKIACPLCGIYNEAVSLDLPWQVAGPGLRLARAIIIGFIIGIVVKSCIRER